MINIILIVLIIFILIALLLVIKEDNFIINFFSDKDEDIIPNSPNLYSLRSPTPKFTPRPSPVIKSGKKGGYGYYKENIGSSIKRNDILYPKDKENLNSPRFPSTLFPSNYPKGNNNYNQFSRGKPNFSSNGYMNRKENMSGNEIPLFESSIDYIKKNEKAKEVPMFHPSSDFIKYKEKRKLYPSPNRI